MVRLADEDIRTREVLDWQGVHLLDFDDFERRLANQPDLLGDSSSLVDIAWFIHATRIASVGDPLAELHPRIAKWHASLARRPEFAGEVAAPVPIRLLRALVRLRDRLTRGSLRTVAGI